MAAAAVKCYLLLALASLSAADYRRPPPRPSLSRSLMELLRGAHPSAPQQVHISLSGDDRMRVSWITKGPSPAVVYYGTSPGENSLSAAGTAASYSYLFYKSGEIHHVVIGPLKPSTQYFYRCGEDDASEEFTFTTPPPSFPIKFAVVGDLGQTEWTKSTLNHVSSSNYDVFLLPGDLSYADVVQRGWDTFGSLVQPLAAARPWMVTQGNHEVERIPILHSRKFTAYNARWVMPHQESNSSSNLYYSFDVAGVHVIMLGSYCGFGADSDQYSWLQTDLMAIDRSKTPWVLALVHAPWYNSNEAHQDEYESTGMKAAMEDLLYRARVDAVFAGHVHAYERFVRVYRDEEDECAPVYITVGDGGNREGLSEKFVNPSPGISAFREGSFGHGQLTVVNGTHAHWSWHRNDDDVAVRSDEVWLTSRVSDSRCCC